MSKRRQFEPVQCVAVMNDNGSLPSAHSLAVGRYGCRIALLFVVLVLTSCAALHDGKGFEHEPGKPSIEHRH